MRTMKMDDGKTNLNLNPKIKHKNKNKTTQI